MNKSEGHTALPAGALVKDIISRLGMSQVELASRCSEHSQTISAILKGQRDIPIPLSVKLDRALDLEPGTIAIAQTKYQVASEMKRMHVKDIQSRKQAILEKVKLSGGLWSYQGIPEHLDDDSIIEAALIHLDLEDMPELFQIWSRSHIKAVWKNRLVSQGKRMNILNYILAVKLFGIRKPDNYLSRYAY